MPQVKQVIDTKPGMSSVIDTKPGMKNVFAETITYLENRTILKGQPMGLLLAITYPEGLDFIAPRK